MAGKQLAGEVEGVARADARRLYDPDPDARGGFGPFTPGFVVVKYGDKQALEAANPLVKTRIAKRLDGGIELESGRTGGEVVRDRSAHGGRAGA